VELQLAGLTYVSAKQSQTKRSSLFPVKEQSSLRGSSLAMGSPGRISAGMHQLQSTNDPLDSFVTRNRHLGDFIMRFGHEILMLSHLPIPNEAEGCSRSQLISSFSNHTCILSISQGTCHPRLYPIRLLPDVQVRRFCLKRSKVVSRDVIGNLVLKKQRLPITPNSS
jgi:hypothetical protein